LKTNKTLTKEKKTKIKNKTKKMEFETPTTMRNRFIFLGGRRGNDRGGRRKDL
jgi:hypothetical protein